MRLDVKQERLPYIVGKEQEEKHVAGQEHKARAFKTGLYTYFIRLVCLSVS